MTADPITPHLLNFEINSLWFYSIKRFGRVAILQQWLCNLTKAPWTLFTKEKRTFCVLFPKTELLNTSVGEFVRGWRLLLRLFVNYHTRPALILSNSKVFNKWGNQQQDFMFLTIIYWHLRLPSSASTKHRYKKHPTTSFPYP